MGRRRRGGRRGAPLSGEVPCAAAARRRRGGRGAPVVRQARSRRHPSAGAAPAAHPGARRGAAAERPSFPRADRGPRPPGVDRVPCDPAAAVSRSRRRASRGRRAVARSGTRPPPDAAAAVRALPALDRAGPRHRTVREQEVHRARRVRARRRWSGAAAACRRWSGGGSAVRRSPLRARRDAGAPAAGRGRRGGRRRGGRRADPPAPAPRAARSRGCARAR